MYVSYLLDFWFCCSLGPRSVSDDSEFSIGDLSELSNAQKCKQYREKNKEKRRQDERNYEKALQRNIELKRISQEKKETIRKVSLRNCVATKLNEIFFYKRQRIFCF